MGTGLMGPNLSCIRCLSLILAFSATAVAQAQAAQSGASSAAPVAYIGPGKMDLALSGQLDVPQTGGAFLNISAAAGRYVSQSSLVGVGVGFSAVWQPGGSNSQGFQLTGHYRYLFHTHNPKIFPFVGVAPGVSFEHISTGPAPNSPQSPTIFHLVGEAGVKCFIARNVSLEPAYDFVYTGSYQTVPSSRESVLGIGLAFTL